ncbi:MAG: hypothetical protein AMXMBFR23_11280 [Chloroflexota bacterium]
MRRMTGLLGLALAAAALVACSGDEATPTPAPTATASPTATSAGLESVREVDLTDVVLLGPIIDHFGGGQVEPARTTYVDVTGDGREEAVLFVESGGTQGDVGVAVVQVDGGNASVLGYVPASGRVELAQPEAGGGVIVTREGIWKPGDAECCPSELRERFYQWDGTAFAVTVDQVIPNPNR